MTAVDERLALVRDAAGARIEDIELNIRAFIVRVTDDRAGAVSQIASFVQVEDEMIAASPFALDRQRRRDRRDARAPARGARVQLRDRRR